MNAIEIEELVFGYNDHQSILNIPKLTIQKGESIFLFGPSGCGKTTLLGLLTGILIAKAGTLKVLDSEPSKMSAHRRDRFRADQMGYIFQQFNLIPYLNVIENICLPLWMSQTKKSRVQKEDRDEAKDLASRLGLKESFNQNVSKLSIGQQQRVAVARALIGSPELVVADEPTSALDDDRQMEFIDLLLEKTRDKKATVVFASHNRKLAAHFDRTISLSEINLVQTGNKL